VDDPERAAAAIVPFLRDQVRRSLDTAHPPR
jgi:hypothetical protein